jgi:phosphopantetheine--protein transferase-like protein
MIGVDLVFVPEFQKRLNDGGQAFLQRAFLASEMKNRRPEHLAGLWAAKEAVAKAAENAPRKWTDIVISHDVAGKPSARLGRQQFAVSIAHHGDYAVAVAQRMEA